MTHVPTYQEVTHTRLAQTVGSGGTPVLLCIGRGGKRRIAAPIAGE